MAVKLNSVVRFLNKEIKVKSVKDRSKNGLQVRATRNVSKVGLATDSSIDLFKKAKRLNCDFVIVHHGLFWKGERDSLNINKDRVAFLKKNHISLYAVHLPLDKHKKHGHNTYLFNLLGAKPKEIFGGVGYLGYFDRPRSINSILKELNGGLRTKCNVWRFGKKSVMKLAIVSGAGTSDILEAVKKGVDLFITGEVSSRMYYCAKERKLNVILAGHYKTETSGVKTLGKLLQERFRLKTVFIDLPTGL